MVGLVWNLKDTARRINNACLLAENKLSIDLMHWGTNARHATAMCKAMAPRSFTSQHPSTQYNIMQQKDRTPTAMCKTMTLWHVRLIKMMSTIILRHVNIRIHVLRPHGSNYATKGQYSYAGVYYILK